MATYTSSARYENVPSSVFTSETQYMPLVASPEPRGLKARLSAAAIAGKNALKATRKVAGAVAHELNVAGGDILENSIDFMGRTAQRSYDILRRPSNAVALGLGTLAIGLATRNFNDIAAGVNDTLQATSDSFAGVATAEGPSTEQQHLGQNVATSTGLVLGGLGAYLYANVRGTMRDEQVNAMPMSTIDAGTSIIQPEHQV